MSSVSIGVVVAAPVKVVFDRVVAISMRVSMDKNNPVFEHHQHHNNS